MIVKCEQCQTRFKIPDDRVTDKGVKVRCTKCQHMFRVTREMGQPSAVPAASVAPPAPLQAPRKTMAPPVFSPPPPPGGLEADPFARFGGPSDAGAHDETRPGVFALGVEASKVPDLRLFPPPDPIRPAPAPSQPFDFSTLAPSAPPPAPKPAPRASSPKPLTTQMPRAEPPKPHAAPFDFAGLTSTPSPPAPKVSPGASPFDFSALGPSAAPDAGNGGLAFDFSMLGPSTALPPPAASAPPPNLPPPPAFDFSSLGPSPTSAMSPNAASTKVAAFESAPAFDPSSIDLPPAPRPSSPLFADVPDLNEPSSGTGSTIEPTNVPDDFFGTPLSPPPSAPRASAPGSYRSGGGSKEDLFEMPRAAGAEPAAPSAPRPQISIAGAPPTPMAGAAPTQFQSPEVGPRRSALGLVVNLGIAVVLVTGLIIVGSALLNEGTLDASTFSPDRLKALVTRESDFETGDISNGLYDTLRGKPVFYVRGEVTNLTATSTRVRIRAEILDGDTMVRAAEVVAGTPPTPEQLRNLTGADEVERLLATVSKTAPTLAPGEGAPFLVTFFEYPPDLKAFRVRVSARAEGAETAER